MINYLLFLSPSGGEIIVVLIAVLMLFGADKIPELARGVGKGIREIKNATGEIQNEITKSVVSKDLKEIKQIKEDLDITKNIQNDLDPKL
jgi:sec-independent protein translocase protein TatA